MTIFTPARRVLYAPSEEAIQVPFVIDRHAGVLPSFATDFAHNANESEYPECWRGLVGFWPIFLGQTGSRIIDLSGWGNDGIEQQDSVWQPGKYGTSRYFSGDDYLDCGSNSILDITGDKTIIAYTKIASGISTVLRIFNRMKPSTHYDGYQFIYWDDGRIAYGFDGDWVQSTSEWDDGESHQIAVSVQGTTAYFYGDGKADGSGVVSANTSYSGNAEIGRWSVSFFGGNIEYLYIYNRALSAGEIAFLSSNPTALVQLRRRAVMVSLGEVIGGINYEDLLLGVSVSASVVETDTQQMVDTLKDVSIAVSIMEADTQQMLDTEKVVTFAASVSVTDILSGVVNYEDLLLGVSVSASVTEADTQQMLDTEKAVTFAAGISEVDTQQMLDTDKAVSFAASVSETDTQQMVDTDLGVTVVASLNIADTQQMKDLLKGVSFTAGISETDTQQMKDLLKAVTFAASCSIETEVYYDASAVVVAMYAFIILRQHTS